MKPTTDCVLFDGGIDKKGYGRVMIKGVAWYAHRLVWERFYGPIPDGICVCHHCDNPPCVRPDHLFLGTRGDNAHDRNTKGRQAQGDRNGARTHPEKLARGDRNGSRLHPESRPRGEKHATAKLNTTQVRDICSRIEQSNRELAREFGVSDASISLIRSGKIWANVQ